MEPRGRPAPRDDLLRDNVTASPVPELDSYVVVLLRRGPRASDFSDEELDDLQARHVAYMDRLRHEGVLLINGPFANQPDQTLRGFCVYRCPAEQARALAEADPSVEAGRLRTETFTWFVPKGTLVRSQGS